MGLTSKVLTGNGQDGRPGGFAVHSDAGTLAPDNPQLFVLAYF